MMVRISIHMMMTMTTNMIINSSKYKVEVWTPFVISNWVYMMTVYFSRTF